MAQRKMAHFIQKKHDWSDYRFPIRSHCGWSIFKVLGDEKSPPGIPLGVFFRNGSKIFLEEGTLSKFIIASRRAEKWW